YFDPMLRWTLISGSRSVVGSQVEITGLKSSLLNGEIELQNVRVANPRNPMEDLLVCGKAKLHLETVPLLHRKVVVAKAEFHDVAWNEPREISGEWDGWTISDGVDLDLPAGLDAPIDLDVNGLKSRAKDAGLAGLESLRDQLKQQVAPGNFETVRVAKHLEAKWTARFKAYKVRADAARDSGRGIRDVVENTGGNFFQKIQSYRRAAADLEKLLAELHRIPLEIQQGAAEAHADVALLEQAKERDKARLQQMLSAPRCTAESLDQFLLESEISQQIRESVAWVQWIRYWFLDGELDEEDHERLRGITVAFPRDADLPAVLIRSLVMTGKANVGGRTVPFQAELSNLSGRGAKLREPTRLHLVLESKTPLTVDAEFDRTGDVPRDHIVIRCDRLPISETTFGDPERLALTVTKSVATIEVDLTLVGDQLSGELRWSQDGGTFVPRLGSKLGGGLIETALQASLAKIESVEATVTVSGTLDKPQWEFHSPLGSQVAEALNGFALQQVAVAKQKVAVRVENIKRRELAKLEKIFATHPGQLLQELQQSNQEVQRVKRLASEHVTQFNRFFR
ncbi:MAG: hypothetical protein N2C14_12290, partial [Planctomycetales bacterium]